MTMSAVSTVSDERDPTVSKWYGAATVRKAERILVPSPATGEFIYPKSRQILSGHPAVTRRGDDAIAFVLAQSAYRYMYEIGLLETRFVIDCALNIVNNRILGANESEKREALAVVIDEGYHAYVALDFIVQMKARTGIAPVFVPDTNGNLSAVGRAFERLPVSMHMDFQLVSVCLAEHTLTKDLLSIGREKDLTPTFTRVMTDHVSDEGRHANYFARMMTAHWARIPDTSRTAIAEMLPGYLDDYLAGDEERGFDRTVLRALGLSEPEVIGALADTQETYLAGIRSYVATTKGNLVKLLQRSRFFEYAAVKASFAAHGIVGGTS